MDSNLNLFARAFRHACIASFMLAATGVSAQTIYKQVDENGRVMFTDQPSASARVVTSYESGRTREGDSARTGVRRMPAEVLPDAPRPAPTADAVREPVRGAAAAARETAPAREIAVTREADSEAMPDAARAESARRQGGSPFANWQRVTPSSPEITARRAETPASQPVESQRTAEPAPKTVATVVTPASSSPPSAPVQTAALQPMQAQSPATTYNDVTRAVNTYSALNTPLAVQVDASESARRARQEMNKGNLGSPVLVVRAPAKDHETAQPKSGIGAFYVLWVGTFLVLAAGLLYVAWQVIRLIMGNAFPRWQIGAG